MRAHFRFCVLLFLFASMVSITVGADTRVRYLHLALTGEPTSMSVGWYTEGPPLFPSFAFFMKTADSTATSQCKYWQEGSSQTFLVNGTVNQWLRGYGYNHFATLENLKLSTRCAELVFQLPIHSQFLGGIHTSAEIMMADGARPLLSSLPLRYHQLTLSKFVRSRYHD